MNLKFSLLNFSFSISLSIKKILLVQTSNFCRIVLECIKSMHQFDKLVQQIDEQNKSKFTHLKILFLHELAAPICQVGASI